MSVFPDNQQKINEIIFANRNKSYGAYAIRSQYGTTVFKSLSIVTGSMLVVTSLLIWLNKKEVDIPELIPGNIPVTVEVDMSKIFENVESKPNTSPEGRPPKSEPPSQAATVATRITDSLPSTTQSITPAEPVASSNPSTSSSGEPSDGNGIQGGSTGSSGTGGNAGTGEKEGNPVELFGLDEHPEFEGGLNALNRFVASRLVYPSAAREENIQGTLYVKFVVDETGKVGEIMMQNNLGYGLEQEASRVIKQIPNFKKPGKIKGQAVKTYYQLPIRFRISH
ncbi:MAG: energy transducer TonB [Sediminibacterium sp.]|nr:energy transducer TonB [Sediminibacterium sp.]